MDLIALTFMTRKVNLNLGIFHFKGVWAGEVISQLELSGIKAFQIQVETEYILHLEGVDYCQSRKVIKANIVKARALDT